MDREISCVTVFGGTGFVGRRVARHLRGSGATVRIASRHPRRAEGDSLDVRKRNELLPIDEFRCPHMRELEKKD
jgi:nucleoside-diphosphate-sugar epimerase